MPRIWRSRVLLSIVSTFLVVGAAWEVSVPTAHAQFPIFNGRRSAHTLRPARQ